MEFLMEIMEAREQLEGTPSKAVIDANRIGNGQRLKRVCDELSAAFGNNDLGGARKVSHSCHQNTSWSSESLWHCIATAHRSASVFEQGAG
jgi:hypothetical protein